MAFNDLKTAGMIHYYSISRPRRSTHFLHNSAQPPANTHLVSPAPRTPRPRLAPRAHVPRPCPRLRSVSTPVPAPRARAHAHAPHSAPALRARARTRAPRPCPAPVPAPAPAPAPLPRAPHSAPASAPVLRTPRPRPAPPSYRSGHRQSRPFAPLPVCVSLCRFQCYAIKTFFNFVLKIFIKKCFVNY